jgi:carboxyl-terminal processing protease
MRPEEHVRKGWLALALMAGSILNVAWAVEPDASTRPTADVTAPAIPKAIPGEPSQTLQRGLDFERKRNWASAIRLYEDALEQWPSRSEFGHRLRLCETHYKLVRRYQDRSFRDILLKLPRGKAIELYDELVDRIESHYVDRAGLEPMIRRGYDNLEVALRDPGFLRLNTKNADPARVSWLRQSLRERRDVLEVASRGQARAEVLAACELAQQGLGITAAPVILEFTYGACDVLDPYSSYLTPDKLDDMFSMIDGNFVGLGVELKQDDLGLRLVGVIKDGPAAEAGLKVGDKITAVGPKSVKGLGLDEAAGYLQGGEGTQVEITVLFADGTTRNLRLVRRHVEVASVAQAKIVDKLSGVGYIQLTGFQKTSTDELDRAIQSLQRQGLRSLVLDLRGNPGGLLNVAVDIADRFVDRGVIVSTKGRAPGQTQVYRARPDLVYTMPLAVLIDRDSASASEILAGALKDLDRATIVGDHRSYGKGSVQSIFELRTVPAGLKLTTAQFYSPTGRPYSEQGVEPKILVKLDQAANDTQRHVVGKPVVNPETGAVESAPAYEVGNPKQDTVLIRAISEVAQQKALTAR